MAQIIGIAGSLRRQSLNAALLRAAAALVPDGSRLIVDSIAGIPLYDGDVEENEGVPEPVRRLQDGIASGDALLLVTPEYNHSLPGTLKNAIDWLSRPTSEIVRVFHDRPVGLMGASPGRVGTAFSQTAWLPVFRRLGMRAWFGRSMYVGGASRLFDDEGTLIDEGTRDRVRDYLAGFCEFVDTHRSPDKES